MNLHLNAPPSIFKIANQLRRNMTTAEKLLWQELKGNKLLGEKFRRQHPMMRYILDFYNHKNKLCIELDGEIHNQYNVRTYDRLREAHLNENGICVIRFKNQEVIQNIDSVVSSIMIKIQELRNTNLFQVK